MADWAVEFAHEVLKSEALTRETWAELCSQFRKAISDINEILEGKSKTKLTLVESPDAILLTSNLNRQTSLNLDAHARTISVAVERDVYSFRLTKDHNQLVSIGSQVFPGNANGVSINSTTVVDYLVKAVIDLKN